MRSYFDKSLIAAGFAATVAIVSMSCLACAGTAQTDKTNDDDGLTAEQCIDNNTPGSVGPYEDDLVAEGIVDDDLDKIIITRGMCEEIIERTPGGSPIRRAAAVGNLTQELELIKSSMKDAADKDVNGDGRVDAEDTKVAVAASYAASRAAQETVRRAAEEGSTDGGAVEELNAVFAAYLAQEQAVDSASSTATATSTATASSTATATSTAPAEQTTMMSEETTMMSEQSTTASVSATASAAASEAPPAGEDQAAEPSSHKKAQTNASSAARGEDASQKAAEGGANCAATVALSDETLRVVAQGHMIFDGPAKVMPWKATDRMKLVAADETSVSIEQLKQEVDQAKGAGVGCLRLGHKLEASFVHHDDFDITAHDARKQDLLPNENNTWTWDIEASEKGENKLLHLNVTTHMYSESQGGGYRAIPRKPSLFDDYINVKATSGAVFTDFVARRWSVLVPLLLTILTAIIIPFVVPWWKRRNQPSEPTDRSRAPQGDRWI